MRLVPTDTGLLVPEAALTEPAPPEQREIAGTEDGRDITIGYVDGLRLLQPQDDVLKARGGGWNYAIYDQVLRDDQVASTFAQRRLAVVSREWEVQPGGGRRVDQAAADSLRAQLEAVNARSAEDEESARSPLPGFDAATDKMLYGIFWGYAVAECMWGRDGREIAIDGLKVKRQQRFGFSPDGRLRLKTSRNPEGEELPPRKFWAFSTGGDTDDDPYGLGLAHWLYWPCYFKRNGLRYWLKFVEKFSMPTAKGEYPPNATQEEKQSLLAALRAVQSDSGIILPQGMVVDLIEAQRSGSVEYGDLYRILDAAISKVVLGQTMTTDSGSSRSQAEVHMDVRQDLVKADADLICNSFNATVARWLTDWNYPGAAYPRVWRRIDDEPDLKPLAERDQLIAEMGFRPTLQYVIDTYGGEWTERPQAAPGDLAPAPRQAPGFAEAAADPAAALADRLEDEAADALEGLLDPVRALVENATSLDEIRDGLLERYRDMDRAALGMLVQRALAAAELAGRYDAAQGD